MADIWSLDALCRCCHADGEFKNLQEQHKIGSTVENYLQMLYETLGISIKPPPAKASYSICDACITQLRSASQFKRQVLLCETKFEEYCKNELSQDLNNAIKTEPEYLDDNIFDSDEEKGNIIEENAAVIPKSLKNIKKEDSEESVKIVIEIEPKIEKKAVRKKIKAKAAKAKPKQIKVKPIKPKEEESLVVKVKTETGQLFSCKNCGVSYEDLDELNNHINDEHYKGFKCVYCNEAFPNERQYKIHNHTMHGDSRPFLCPHCGKKVGSKLSLSDHINSVHTKEKFYQCDECQKKFHSKSVLRIHLNKHNGTFRKLICEQCGVGCNDRTNLRYHIMSVHEKIRMFECNICGRKFSAAKHVKAHIRTHTGERPFECDICLNTFMTKEGLNTHRRIHDNVGYKCKRCDDVFPTRGQYASHYRNHVGHKEFKCHLCSKEFAGKYSLKRHVFEHSGERPFACEICNKNFKQKPMLVRHNLRMHNPFKRPVVKEKCDICKRTVPNLDKHMQAHSNKPFACHLCDKRYPLQNALNRHLQRHTGEKPHKCDLCERGFIQMKSLKNHKLKVHKLPLKTEQEDHYDTLVTTYTIQNLKRK